MPESVYEYSCESITGETVPLESFRGQVMLVVNTASYCGFTPQYKGLEFLYRELRDRGFTVLGFPCNQFNYQEPRNNERISEFCMRNYAVSFPLFAKLKVNGPDADPLYQYLTARAPGILGTRPVKYNFTKFLVHRDGSTVQRFAPTTFPRRLMSVIDKALESGDGGAG